MADEQTGAAPGAETPAPGQVQNIGGGAIRVQPNSSEENAGPTLEEQNAAQEAAKNKPAAAEGTPPAKEGEDGKAPETPAKTPAAEGVDLKGTVFEGLSPEMQGKVAPYAAAYAENGTLTDAEVSEAAKATGFSEAAVRQFMAGAEAAGTVDTSPVINQFGGEAPFREFQQWTAEDGNLTPAEARTINKALGLGPDGKPDSKLAPDPEMAAQLMAAPMERWKAAGGGAGARDVTQQGAGGGGSQEAGDVYGSWAAVTKDQSKAEYRDDPDFRRQVEQKIARSTALN